MIYDEDEEEVIEDAEEDEDDQPEYHWSESEYFLRDSHGGDGLHRQAEYGTGMRGSGADPDEGDFTG